MSNLSLLPDHHPTKDFFIADIFDSLPFKDDMASMEYPLFSLSKKKDARDLHFCKGNIHISIKPNSDGLPTIFDKDVLMYCGSLLMDRINKDVPPVRTLRISSHDLLVATNRPTNGKGYRLLKMALDRLQGVSIKTNIKTNRKEITSAFGLIDRYEIIESSRVKDRMVRLEITLSEWFYNSILGKEVLTINKDYFRLGKPLERRLYEVARKHCGRNSEWKIGLFKLKEKTGSTSNLSKFRFFIKQIQLNSDLPDYYLILTADDLVTFYPKSEFIEMKDMPRLSRKVIDTARKMVEESGVAVDFEDLHTQFSLVLMKGFKPNSVDGAFVGFVKKKIKNCEKSLG